MQDLTGLKVLVTGGTSGIGKAIARDLASEGCKIVISGRNAKAGEALEVELGDASFIKSDITGHEAPEVLIEEATRFLGGLDCLINSAGVVLSQPLEDSLPEEWDIVMNTNARAPFFLSRAALPHLRKSDRGVIVNIGSVVSVKGYPLQSVYTASKHALLGWTKSLAAEVYEEGIRVHAILPGGVDTPLAEQVRPDLGARDLMSPEEIAEAVRFIIGFRGRGVIDEIQIHRGNSLPWK